MYKYLISFSTLLLLFATAAAAKDYDITDFGAKPDGKTLCTKAIQKAIDECAKNGGGRVVAPTGAFLSGTLYLKNNVTLYLEKGATLYGSIDSVDYPLNAPKTVKTLNTHGPSGKPKRNFALLYAEAQENIGIGGEGTIDGNGQHPFWQRGDNGPNRPKVILFISCKRVTVENVTLTNSPFWMQDYLGCDGVKIRGITVFNHANWNNDGLDIDSKNVIVSDCIIDSDDDGICLKSYLNNAPCENVVVTNCVVASNCNAIKMGTPGYGGFKNIAIQHCTVNASKVSHFRKWTERYKQITTDPSMVTGLSIECVDGGASDNIVVSHLTMKATQTPIFIKVANRQAKFKDEIDTRVSSMKNVIISNIIAEVHSRRTCSVTAYPGTKVENVQLHNLIFDVMSTGVEADKALIVKENEGAYPSTHMLGDVLPAYGFFVRHVDRISIRDVHINLARPDGRYALTLDDVQHAYLNQILVHNRTSGATSLIGPADVQLGTATQVFLENAKISKE
jgi:polygalacturonase